MIKESLGLLSVVCAAAGFSSYFWSIYKGETKPHAFSWIVWGLITGIIFWVQVTEDAGPGAWVTGFSTLGHFVVVCFAIFCGEKNITKSDWLTFISALTIVPVWRLTHDPLWAVIMATTIDLLAYYPTFRKSYLQPQHESWIIYGLDVIKWIPALFALNHFTLTVALYPVCILTANGGMAIMILARRRILKSKETRHL